MFRKFSSANGIFSIKFSLAKGIRLKTGPPRQNFSEYHPGNGTLCHLHLINGGQIRRPFIHHADQMIPF